MTKRIIFMFCIVLVFFSCNDMSKNEEKKSKTQDLEIKENVLADIKKNKTRGNNFEVRLEADSSFFPTSYDYLKHGLNYKSVVAYKKWAKRGIEKLIAELPEDGDNWGRVYTENDIGVKEIKIAKFFNSDGQVVFDVERGPYENYLLYINEYDSFKHIIAIYRKSLFTDVKPFTDEFFKVEELEEPTLDVSYEYSDIAGSVDYCNRKKYTYYNHGEKKLEDIEVIKKDSTIDFSKIKTETILKIRLNDLQTDFAFFFDNKGLLYQITPMALNGWLLYDVKYDNNDILTDAIFSFDNKKSTLHYKYTRYDKYGNWLEAEVFANDNDELSYSIIREIEYYDSL